MNDSLIYKQAAIDVANAIWSVTGDKNVAKVWDQLKDLPPVQPERKKGKWLKWEALNGLTYGSICSECGYIISAVPNYGTKYCPDCGAEMEKPKE